MLYICNKSKKLENMEKIKTIKTIKMDVPKDPNQRKIMELYPQRNALRKSLAPSYYPIKHHIYFDGSSFRVRVMVKGKTISINVMDKVEAIELRDYLLNKQ